LLQSMTGFGESHCQQDGLAVAVEVRTINNRFFKLTVRASEGYASLDALVEAIVREAIHREPSRSTSAIDRRRSPRRLQNRRRHLGGLPASTRRVGPQVAMQEYRAVARGLLPLPGVVDDASGVAIDATADWPTIENTLKTALENLGRIAHR